MENNTQSDIAGKYGKQYTVKSCCRTSKIKQSDLAANIKNITVRSENIPGYQF